MSKINCNLDCKHSKNDCICELDDVTFSLYGCEDYTETDKPICNDKYYTFLSYPDTRLKDKFWKAKMGILSEFRGREVFRNGYNEDHFTDGKTGVAGSFERCSKVTDEELSKTFRKHEEQNGLSPLYTTDLKYPVREFENND